MGKHTSSPSHRHTPPETHPLEPTVALKVSGERSGRALVLVRYKPGRLLISSSIGSRPGKG